MRISLYIHIPFCISKCDYCDFFSVPLEGPNSLSVQRSMLDSIITELKTRLESIPNPTIETIFIGGGTPSAIAPELFHSFLLEISKVTGNLLRPGAEFSTEANIESCSSDFLSAAREGGITRLSLGVQSFRPEILTEIGRACFPEDIFRRVSDIKAQWNGELSMDIISGITEDDIQDIELAVSLKPDHLSVYQLTIEEDTKLYNLVKSGMKTPPNEALQSKTISVINSWLEKEDYSRYEISNYARNEKTCKHNIRYWEMQSYLGIGPSAVSSLYGEDSSYRTSNTRDINKYITAVKNRSSDYQEREDLSSFDFMLEHYIMGGRLCKGINAPVFHKRFGKYPTHFIPRTMENWNNRGLMADGINLNAALNEQGLLFLDAFLSDVYDELSDNSSMQ